jgi:hypothetical protein
MPQLKESNMLGAIIPIPPELQARHEAPKDPQVLRIQANRDRTIGLDALTGRFLPELRDASARLRGERGRLLATDLRKTFAELDRLRDEIRKTLPTREAKEWFDRLSENAMVIESNAISAHASRESRTWRSHVSDNVLRSRIAEAEHHCEDEARCGKAFDDGIAEIDAHAMCHNHGEAHTTERTRRFKSDFAVGRLKGLALADPMKASLFYDTCRDDIDPGWRQGVETLLDRALNDRMAHEFAEAIVAGRPPEGYGIGPVPHWHPDAATHRDAWLAQARAVAAEHFGHDPGIGAIMESHVEGHVASRRRALARQALENRNRLLDAALADDQPAHHQALIARDPQLRLAWAGAPEHLRRRLLAVMAANASGRCHGVSCAARHRLAVLRGMRRADPERFSRVDLSHDHFEPVAAPLRRQWIAFQNAVGADGADLAKGHRLQQWLDVLRGHCPETLNPHAQEWM